MLARVAGVDWGVGSGYLCDGGGKASTAGETACGPAPDLGSIPSASTGGVCRAAKAADCKSAGAKAPSEVRVLLPPLRLSRCVRAPVSKTGRLGSIPRRGVHRAVND